MNANFRLEGSQISKAFLANLQRPESAPILLVTK